MIGKRYSATPSSFLQLWRCQVAVLNEQTIASYEMCKVVTTCMGHTHNNNLLLHQKYQHTFIIFQFTSISVMYIRFHSFLHYLPPTSHVCYSFSSRYHRGLQWLVHCRNLSSGRRCSISRYPVVLRITWLCRQWITLIKVNIFNQLEVCSQWWYLYCDACKGAGGATGGGCSRRTWHSSFTFKWHGFNRMKWTTCLCQVSCVFPSHLSILNRSTHGPGVTVSWLVPLIWLGCTIMLSHQHHRTFHGL